MFDGLDISIGGDSAGAKGAIASVKSELSGLERSMNSAQDSAEELGDEATGTSARLGTLGATAGASLVSLLGLSSAAKGATGSLAALGVSTGGVTAALTGLAAVAAPLVAIRRTDRRRRCRLCCAGRFGDDTTPRGRPTGRT